MHASAAPAEQIPLCSKPCIPLHPLAARCLQEEHLQQDKSATNRMSDTTMPACLINSRQWWQRQQVHHIAAPDPLTAILRRQLTERQPIALLTSRSHTSHASPPADLLHQAGCCAASRADLLHQAGCCAAPRADLLHQAGCCAAPRADLLHQAGCCAAASCSCSLRSVELSLL